MFLDLRLAFDTVDHYVMLSPLYCRRGVELVSLVPDQTFSAAWLKQVRLSHSVSCNVPQGTVLGPVEFVAYTENNVDLFDRHKVNHHLYAMTINLSTCTSNLQGLTSTCLTRLVASRAGFSDLSGGCAYRRLQLNAANTELIWFGSRVCRLIGDNRSLSLHRFRSCELS